MESNVWSAKACSQRRESKDVPPDSQDKKLDSEACQWKSMTYKQKWRFLTDNITVEPMVACYIVPSVLASLATQNLNLEKACRVNLNYPENVCQALTERNTTGFEAEEIAVQQLVTGMQAWKTALQSGLPSILILFIGAWSDRTGRRKPCMLFPIVGEFLASASLLACTYWFYELPMEVAALEAFWPALTGGWFTMFMGVFSYIADITSVESRTLRIGAVNVFLSIGVPIGLALSGILYLKLGFYGVFTISLCCYFLSFTYGLIVLKDPPKSPQQKLNLKMLEQMTVWESVVDFFSLRHVSETFKIAFKKGARNRQKRVTVLMIVISVVIGPMYGECVFIF